MFIRFVSLREHILDNAPCREWKLEDPHISQCASTAIVAVIFVKLDIHSKCGGASSSRFPVKARDCSSVLSS